MGCRHMHGSLFFNHYIMNRLQLFKQLLPGLLPVFVFILADELWGTQIGLIVAVGFGLAEMLFTWIREHRLDRFIIADTLLLVLMGAISILLNNDIFFKLKPAVIESVFLVILGISVFTPANLVMKMTQRYAKGVSFDSFMQHSMKKSIKTLFWIFALHVILIILSAFTMSREVWAFISGGLLYIFFAIYFLYETLHNKRKAKSWKTEEWLPIINNKGEVTGKAPRSECHNGSMLLHPVIHMHLVNNKGNIFLQKRALTKLIQPGKWDTAVGGHLAIGEELEIALKRETQEELGITSFKHQLLSNYIWESEIEKEMVFMYIGQSSQHPQCDNDEVDEGRYWTTREIDAMLGQGLFTPNFEKEYKMLLQAGITTNLK